MAPSARQPFRVYRVGGSVRDELLGRAHGDRDWVVVGATPEMMVASGFKPVGNDFPVFLHPETGEEYALARTERKHGRGYRGFEFFASPEVTLEDDLARRDLTINAMAIDDEGRLIDPHGGRADLDLGLLRHVSPAFVEDPLRVLRVARFAARFGFAVALETQRMMRDIVASGELSTLAPERVWQELSRGLEEPRPSRMLTELRRCGALDAVLPEVDRLFDDEAPPAESHADAGSTLSRALDCAADRKLSLEARYAVLAHDLVGAASSAVARVRAADALSSRLRVPNDSRDAGRAAARWCRDIARGSDLAPASVLDILTRVDALRRPERLRTVLDACAAIACGESHAANDVPATFLLEALDVVRSVDAGAVARATTPSADRDRIADAIRQARLAALRQWKKRTAARAGARPLKE